MSGLGGRRAGAAGPGILAVLLLGTTVIAGMLAATLIALFLVPMLYVLVERLTKRGADEPPPAPVAPTAPVVPVAGAEAHS